MRERSGPGHDQAAARLHRHDAPFDPDRRDPVPGAVCPAVKVRGHGFVTRTESEVPVADLEKLDVCWAAVQGLGTGPR